jgi:hypothetical protein
MSVSRPQLLVGLPSGQLKRAWPAATAIERSCWRTATRRSLCRLVG